MFKNIYKAFHIPIQWPVGHFTFSFTNSIQNLFVRTQGFLLKNSLDASGEILQLQLQYLRSNEPSISYPIFVPYQN